MSCDGTFEHATYSAVLISSHKITLAATTPDRADLSLLFIARCAGCPRNILRAFRLVVSPSRINIQCISCARLVSRAARFAAREASVVSAALS